MAESEEETLVRRLRELGRDGQIAFAAACCERMLPNYDGFCVMEGWGDPALLRRALDRIWAAVDGREIPADEIQSLLAACDAIIPDAEDVASAFTGVAQYAVASVMHVLEFLSTGKLDELAAAAGLAEESIYEYLHAACDQYLRTSELDEALDQWVRNSPMITDERNLQGEEMELIASWGGRNADLIRRLQENSRSAGIQPIRRGMVSKKRGE